MQLVKKLNQKYSDIIVKRFGTLISSYMITNHIIREIRPNINYRIYRSDLVPLLEYKLDKSYIYIDNIPKFIDIDDKWNDNEKINSNNANILGNFGRFETESIINLPINYANKGNVNYYGAKLFNINELIKFDFNYSYLPLTYMTIGKDYAKNYLEDINLGGGQYLEVHDNPHFHSPLHSDNKGFIILGKKINNKIRLSGFIIPWNTALYTPSGVIHNDGNLIGKWMVCYSKTLNFSTVLLRDKNNNCTTIMPLFF